MRRARPEADLDDLFLVVDGGFLNRESLRGVWHYTIWLDADDAVRGETVSTGAEAAAQSYVRDANPRAAAVAIINNSDPEHPRRVFADAC